MREYVQRLLSDRWSVDAYPDGAAALEAATRHAPALVIADVMMPGLDGFELLRELQADPATADVPVILLSARAGEEARIEGLQAGASDYLVKPFSARELRARVDAQILRAEIRAAQEAHARRLDDIFRQAPVAIAILRGPDHIYEFANEPYLETRGAPADARQASPRSAARTGGSRRQGAPRRRAELREAVRRQFHPGPAEPRRRRGGGGSVLQARLSADAGRRRAVAAASSSWRSK